MKVTNLYRKIKTTQILNNKSSLILTLIAITDKSTPTNKNKNSQ